jgi:hypothetical protein
MPNVPYPYEVNWHLVKGNGSLTPICSLSNRSLSPSLTVLKNNHVKTLVKINNIAPSDIISSYCALP